MSRNYNLSLAANFVQDSHQHSNDRNFDPKRLIKNYNGKSTVINDQLVISFSDKSKAILSPVLGDWTVKKGHMALDFLFDVDELKKITKESFRELLERHSAKKMGNCVIEFNDGTQAKFLEEERKWTIIGL